MTGLKFYYIRKAFLNCWAYQMSCLVDNVLKLNVALQKTMLTSLININKWLLHVKLLYIVCRLKTVSFLVVTEWWVLIRTKTASVYRSLWPDDRIGMIKPFVKLELVSRQTKVQASALCFNVKALHTKYLPVQKYMVVLDLEEQ